MVQTLNILIERYEKYALHNVPIRYRYNILCTDLPTTSRTELCHCEAGSTIGVGNSSGMYNMQKILTKIGKYLHIQYLLTADTGKES